MAQNEVKTYALSVVAALVIAAIAIGGMNALGYITGSISVQVTPGTTISFVGSNNTINFMNLSQGANNNTATYNPWPFVIQNDGNVKVNVSISASQLFNTSALPSSNYQFAANTTSYTGDEGTCFMTDGQASTTTATNMPSSTTKYIGYLNFTDSCDEAETEIFVVVPSAEPAGAKSSTVTITAAAA